MDDKWKAWLQRAKAYGQNLYNDVRSGLDETSGLPDELRAKGEMMQQARQALGQDPQVAPGVNPVMEPYAPRQRMLSRPMSGSTSVLRKDAGPGF